MLGGCSDPTGPPISGPPADLVITPERRTAQGNEYRLEWTAPSGSAVTSYVVEVGSQTGDSDVLTIETNGAGTTFALTTEARGPIFVRVRAKNAGGSSEPSNEVGAEDVRDMIEALFLATGPLRSPAHQPICQFSGLFPDLVNGFPRGTSVDVLVSSTFAPTARTAVETLLAEMETATNDALLFVVAQSSDQAYMENAFRMNQWNRPNEMVILDVTDGQSFCGALGCGGGRLGPSATAPLFRNGFVIAQRDAEPSIAAHELGHAVGLCHVAPEIMGVTTLMGTAVVTAISSPELAAIRSVYGAGLGPGASRQSLRTAGLLGPELTGAPSLIGEGVPRP